MSFQEAISDSRIELTMEEYEKLNMSAFNRPTGGITLDDLQETMLEGTGSENQGLADVRQTVGRYETVRKGPVGNNRVDLLILKSEKIWD